MKKLEIEFLDEFKKLEQLCNKRFGCEHGVSVYIETMEAKDNAGRGSIENWTNNYKGLKRFRWLRNKIVHEETDTEIEKTDLKNIQLFVSQCEKNKDPLALLEKKQTRDAKPKRFSEQQKRNLFVLAIVAAIVLYVSLVVR